MKNGLSADLRPLGAIPGAVCQIEPSGIQGAIRAGRPLEVKQKLIKKIVASWSAITGRPEKQVLAGLTEIDSDITMEYGLILPHPGGEPEWFATKVRRAKWATEAARPASGWQALTKTELAVTRLIGSGLTNRAVADNLGLSPNTIGTHVRSIFAELGIHSRVQLANALHGREAELSGRSPVSPEPPA